ncbi:PorT family protein [Hymenobacter taeanensis]|uniref:PorT family protein n=1 Tax=Hymenobacter taeanensis TaxID=2735321 RepID=A0A6M6BML7_9BACT|nr:outer membrane beta-barrel protein [Hymenobacter taeanensis]QJX48683.1 PorT family protein [Hymenobacter taeanensis]
MAEVSVAYSQTTIHFGPHVGGVATTAAYAAYDKHRFTPRSVLGVALGGTIQAQQKQWALQISGLYAQRGFRLQDEYQPVGTPEGTSYLINETYQLSYLSLPVNLAYTQRPNGQGFQVFAGGYVSMLLKGHWEYNDSFLTPQPNGEVFRSSYLGHDKDILPSPKQPTTAASGLDYYIYSRRVDAGLQAGIGYRFSRVLIQGGV